jgi:hypothetical protein
MHLRQRVLENKTKTFEVLPFKQNEQISKPNGMSKHPQVVIRLFAERNKLNVKQIEQDTTIN